MSDQISKDRSPRSPSATLEESIGQARRLFEQIRTASVKPELAAKALGYSGTNGAAMTVLATLGQYGLVDRAGGDVSITPLAVKILHPKGPDQRDEAILDASTNPKVLNELFNGFFNCSQDVIAGHLIQNGYNPEKAKRLAMIHEANKEFAKLLDPGTTVVDERIAMEEHREQLRDKLFQSAPVSAPFSPTAAGLATERTAPAKGRNMLAQYTIPIGSNEATLAFMGDRLTSDDFDALIDFVTFTKRQFERASKNILIPNKVGRGFPAQAIWKNKDNDTPVTIIGEMGEREGVLYFQTATGTGIPAAEVEFQQG